ncbi:MAG: LacI family DNA-binding transcriptional regulator [Beijerinckiaceae bacterium]
MMQTFKRAPGQRPATATDVAKLAGVSQSAVSRTFTPGASVSRVAREKIKAAAAELGYRPNAIARSLITRRSRIIGVVAAYLQNHFYPEVLERLSQQLQEAGYHIMLFTADAQNAADPLLEEIIGYRIDGLILASTTLSSALAEQCKAAGIPVILFNRTTDTADVSSVTGENARGGAMIAEFLAASGYKRMGFVAGIENSSTSRDRESGFYGWLSRHHYPTPLRAVGNYTMEGAAAAARELLSRPDRPEAIFCGNDHMAIAIAEVARHEFSLSIPNDIALVGFDDVGPAAWKSFDLTSFSQPVASMVDLTIETILDMVEKPGQPPRHLIAPGELVVRGSTRLPQTGLTQVEGRRVWRPVNR